MLRASLHTVAALCALALAGCAPILVQVYVPDASIGKAIYSSCTFNTHIPVGISVKAAGIEAIVSLAKYDGRDFVEVRFDVPQGNTLVLQEGTVQLETTDPKSSSRAEFPLVGLGDRPIVNNFSTLPAVRQRQISITTPLVGQQVVIGNILSVKHFWLATYVDAASAKDVWITMPRFTVNGVSASLPQIHFHRQTLLAVALFNC